MNIIENPHRIMLLWVIKDQSSLVLLFSDGCRRSRLRQSALYLV
jgi:hypothetical protein